MKKYPFYLMSQVIRAKVMSHERHIIDTNELYVELQNVCDILENWNKEQFQSDNEADL